MKKREKSFHTKDSTHQIYDICLRYALLMGVLFSSSLLYVLLKPLTIIPVILILKLFYTVQIIGTMLVLNHTTFIEIVSACIAPSAYLLLLILNLSLSLSLKKRMSALLVSWAMVLFLNVGRIVIFSIWYHEQFIFFDITHKITWYVLSTLFIVCTWFFVVKKYKMKSIPFYTDISFLYKHAIQL